MKLAPSLRLAPIHRMTDAEWWAAAHPWLRERSLPLVKSYGDAMRQFGTMRLAYAPQESVISDRAIKPPAEFVARSPLGYTVVAGHRMASASLLRMIKRGAATAQQLQPDYFRFERVFQGERYALVLEAIDGRAIECESLTGGKR